MKRDMELVRKLLLEFEKIEESERGQTKFIEIEGYEQDKINGHAYLIYEAGLVEMIKMETSGGRLFLPQGLTWEGHEFLAKARNENIWNEGVKIAKEKGLDLGIDIMKTLLSSLTLKALGI